MPIYLVVTPFFPYPDNFRGAFVYDQVKAIERTGLYKVMVFKPCALQKKATSYSYDGIDVDYIPSFFTPSYLFNGLWGSINGKNFLKELQRKGISLKDVDVVHVHTAAFACYASALKKQSSKIKTIIQYHDPDPYQIRLGKLAQWKPNATYRAQKLISQFKYLDLHLCISEKVRYNLLKFPKPHPKECFMSYRRALNVLHNVKITGDLKTYILYNGVDISQFYPQPNQKDTNIFKIGCVGNFVDWKDQMTLIKAIHYLKQQGKADGIFVSFIGSGTTRKECEEYVINNNIETCFVFEEEVHHKDLSEYYRSLDLFVLPSYFEGFGCVFTEAAACGIPFMGCVNQGYSEYIPDEEKSKWLIEPGDFVQLAKNIEEYMKYGYRQRLNETYDINVLIRRYLNYLEKL